MTAVAELAVLVCPPTRHAAITEQRAAVVETRGDRANTGEAGDGQRKFSRLLAAIAQFSELVAAPALHRLVLSERAGVPAGSG
jgi:hypothetical protein